jgi:hypothetical protein
MDLTHTALREVISYDQESGVFTEIKSGARADKPCTSGYMLVYLGGRNYRAHRLAWFYMTGTWPAKMIDHENRCKSDNRWSNLREATPSGSSYNRKGWGKSGLKGVRKEFNKWIAQGSVNGKTVKIGSYDTPDEAHQAYIAFTQRKAGAFFCADS